MGARLPLQLVAVGKEFAGTFAVAEALKNDGAKSQEPRRDEPCGIAASSERSLSPSPLPFGDAVVGNQP
jgi:hypothetical protein